MYELLLTLALIGSLGAFVLVLQVVPVATLLTAGLWLLGAGLGIGLPTSAVYHALLRRSLLRIDALPPGWYWNPTALHGRIPTADRAGVLGFCFVAASGFVAIVVGCLAVALAAWRSA